MGTLKLAKGKLSTRCFWRRARRRSDVLKITDTSRVFVWVSYDRRRRVLCAQFRNGKRYRYDGVSPLVAKGLFTAESAGGFFNEKIKGAHPTWRLV
jgi:hypothetical protein